jgi:hypothetical protein
MRMEASRGSSQGGRGPCATCGGGKVAQEGKTGAAELAGGENRSGGSAVPWGEGDGRPQLEEWDQGEAEKLIGVLNGSRSGRWAGKTAAAAANTVSGKAGGRRSVDGLVCNFQKFRGLTEN